MRLLHKDLARTALHWVQVLRVDPDNRFVHGLLAKIFRLTPTQLKELSLGTFIYAGLFTTEGIGLLLRKRWAEYFTIVTTGGLLPLEIFELARHFTIARLAVRVCQRADRLVLGGASAVTLIVINFLGPLVFRWPFNVVDNGYVAGDSLRLQFETQRFNRRADTVAKGLVRSGGKAIWIERKIVVAAHVGAVYHRRAPHSTKIARELGHPDVPEDDLTVVV